MTFIMDKKGCLARCVARIRHKSRETKMFSYTMFVVGAQMNHLIQMIYSSTHNIHFGREMRKKIMHPDQIFSYGNWLVNGIRV